MYLVKEELLYLMGAYILVTSVLNGSLHISGSLHIGGSLHLYWWELTYWWKLTSVLVGAYILVWSLHIGGSLHQYWWKLTSVLVGELTYWWELTYWCGAYILVRASLYGLQRYYLQRRMMFGVCVLGIKE